MVQGSYITAAQRRGEPSAHQSVPAQKTSFRVPHNDTKQKQKEGKEILKVGKPHSDDFSLPDKKKKKNATVRHGRSDW